MFLEASLIVLKKSKISYQKEETRLYQSTSVIISIVYRENIWHMLRLGFQIIDLFLYDETEHDSTKENLSTFIVA